MQTLLLNGSWDFAFLPQALAEIDLKQLKFNETINVPGCFDAAGKYRYLRGSGFYRKYVEVGGKIKLEADCIGLRGTIYFDGKVIGKCAKAFTAEEFVFDAGEYGQHELLIVAENIIETGHDSMFHPYYDYYAFGGIYRGVSITFMQETFLEKVHVTPLDLGEHTVKISVTIAGKLPAGETLKIAFDRNPEQSFEVSAKEIDLTLQVPDCRIWSPEDPQLHQLRVEFAGDSRVIRFGMRKVGISDGRITLNGKVLKLIGFNRHDSHPDFGYAIPEEILRKDLLMIKEKGYNFIRGCHYAQSEMMLDLCDELGLLVWDESLAWGNTVESMNDETFIRHQIDQTRQMIERSFNHPSIIMWGFLNEAQTDHPGCRKLFETLTALVRKSDPSRLVTFASRTSQKDLVLDLMDVISFNVYPGWYRQENFQQFPRQGVLDELRLLSTFAKLPQHQHKALILSEVGAAALIGDHSGMRWSEEYQSELLQTVLQEIWDEPRWSGVAFWHFADTKTYSDGRAIFRPRGYNNKGLVNEYRQPKMAWDDVGNCLATLLNK